MKKPARRTLLAVSFLLTLVAVGTYQTGKPLPAGIDYTGEVRRVPPGAVTFLRDLTYRNGDGAVVHEQEIFNNLLEQIDRAQKYILIDMFLFNSYTANSFEPMRDLASELAERLVSKKRRQPSIRIDFITDPINTVYGGFAPEELADLEGAGINVILTDLRHLRDSNPGYSSFWRLFAQWFGNSDSGGLFPHPFSDVEAGVTLRSYLDMLNFKANHRKAFIADDGEHMVAIITSANPHDGSSAHSNVAFRIAGGLWRDVLEAEKAVARFSGGALSSPSTAASPGENGSTEGAEVLLITERGIKERVLALIGESGSGDRLWLAMFYLSDRDVVESLLGAAGRGARVRLILDPNRDAFGYSKNGIPNRQTAGELVEGSGGALEVRWYDTRGEQFHSKMVFLDRGSGDSTVILGSANLTRRNLENYNLELDVQVTAPGSLPPITEIRAYFERIWENRGGSYTVAFDTFADDSMLKKMVYRLQEYTGLCTY